MTYTVSKCKICKENFVHHISRSTKEICLSCEEKEHEKFWGKKENGTVK